MERTELGLVPLLPSYPMPSGRPPVVNRLALFAAPSPAIGTVVCAISTIDTADGWVPDGSGGSSIENGIYGFSADDGGRPIVLDRCQIGDVFVLEALLGLGR